MCCPAYAHGDPGRVSCCGKCQDCVDSLLYDLEQDHKQVGDGDKGLNTGGMGAYSPAPIMTSSMEEQVLETIIRPTCAALVAEGVPYRGVLFAGLMINKGKVGI